MNSVLRCVSALVTCVLCSSSLAFGNAGTEHKSTSIPATFSVEDHQAVIKFGPVDLPTGSHEDLSRSVPKSIFIAPRNLYIVGYRAKAFLKNGDPLPGHYVHHILLSKFGEESPSCPGELNFFAGTGFEMTEAKFPAGYGVRIEKGQRFMALLDFYHESPPTKDVIVTVTMELTPEGARLEPLLAYHVGVNVGCYSKFHERAKDETMDGITLQPGIMVRSRPLKFTTEGCVKYAYPHGHDQLLLMTLDNKTTHQTLLRTVPKVSSDGTLLDFPASQVYSDPVGFPVNTTDEYEVTMVYHKPLEDGQPTYGMANYNLYMTRTQCRDKRLVQDDQ